MHWIWAVIMVIATSTAAVAEPADVPAGKPAAVAAVATSAAPLAPAKMWFAPDQPLTINVKPGGEAQLILADFAGKVQEPKGSIDVATDKSVDLHELYQDLSITPGTYVLFLVKKSAATKDMALAPADFLGTPLVIDARQDTRPGAPTGVMVTHVEPLRFVVMHTAAGAITAAFYFDVAPNTADNFLRLADEGFYDGLTFHRILPGFIIQGGDPRGDRTGSAGYRIDAEFSNKPHKAGVLSMARNEDPAERSGDALPRPEFANSASSQFSICLDYAKTKVLDKKYTAFGEVVSGMDAVNKIAATPLDDLESGKPKERQVIEKIEVKPVTAAKNPYAVFFRPPADDGTVPLPPPPAAAPLPASPAPVK